MTDDDLLARYDYALPPELIAAVPLPQREASRLLAVDRGSQTLVHQQFSEFPGLLRPGDVLVLNQTRVIPARLCGYRQRTGGKWEGLFLRADALGRWSLIGHSRGRLQCGETIVVMPPGNVAPHGTGDPLGQTAPVGASDATHLELRLLERSDDGHWLAMPDPPGSAWELLDRFGRIPLPPYLHRAVATPQDRERYQTTYARVPGAVAAPTAGLHFTPQILAECEQHGVQLAYLTLHVGLGTFRPITAQRLSEHQMHYEWCELPRAAVDVIQAARAAGGRVVAVGTTSVRTLETVAAQGDLRPWSGETNLFIRPPYPFRAVDALLTNFHLPRSTLLVLLCAFAGRELVLRAYAEAIDARYRFFSYGDAMLVT